MTPHKHARYVELRENNAGRVCPVNILTLSFVRCFPNAWQGRAEDYAIEKEDREIVWLEAAARSAAIKEAAKVALG